MKSLPGVVEELELLWGLCGGEGGWCNSGLLDWNWEMKDLNSNFMFSLFKRTETWKWIAEAFL